MTKGAQQVAGAKALAAGAEREAEASGQPLRGPFLTPGGDLVIPFDSDPKYHWWKGGQSVKVTLAELKAARDVEG